MKRDPRDELLPCLTRGHGLSVSPQEHLSEDWSLIRTWAGHRDRGNAKCFALDIKKTQSGARFLLYFLCQGGAGRGSYLDKIVN